MSDYDSLYQRSLYLSPDQQDLLFAALASSDQFTKGQNPAGFNPGTSNQHQSPPGQKHSQSSSGPEPLDSPPDDVVGSGNLGGGTDESPFLDFDFDADFDFNGNGPLIGDLPGLAPSVDDAEYRDKRKSIDDQEEDEGGKKRKENDDKIAKKPGRKPLTSEPTTKRKAQNRAAQRAFRERKEKHLKDLETKVEDLEKASQAVNDENSLLRSQVNRLQIELKEYRKRLSWISSGNSISQSSNPLHSRSRQSNEFTFEFPKFGDVNSQLFGNSKKQTSSSSMPPQQAIPGVLNRNLLRQQASGQATGSGQWLAQVNAVKNGPNPGIQGLYNRSSSVGGRNDARLSQNGANVPQRAGYNSAGTSFNLNYPAHSLGTPPVVSNSDSPSASSESQHGQPSSIGTSPEPTANSSPQIGKSNDPSKSQSGNKTASPPADVKEAFYAELEKACGCVENPIPAAFAQAGEQPHLLQQQASPDNGASGNIIDTNKDNNNEENDDPTGLNWLIQQNGGQFDPALFNDYREPQDAVLSQEFGGGGFFDDAFPFPNFDYGNASVPSKADQLGQVDSNLPASNEEVVPAEDRSKMLSCTKIWDRLQAMESFRNGELDVDNLCTELRTKARCSESGVVVNQKDVEEIVSRAK